MVAAFSVAVYVVAPPKALLMRISAPNSLDSLPSLRSALLLPAMSVVSPAAVAAPSRSYMEGHRLKISEFPKKMYFPT